MNHELLLLIISAFSIGAIHTLLGPDHYLPFIALARGRNWNLFKTARITIFCGIGHVFSGFILGVLGIFLGITLKHLNFIETWRGEIAAWVLIVFGFAYLIWGIKKAIKNEKHAHQSFKKLTPWVLFVIFVLGPCEPLIPLIMYPAIRASFFSILMVGIAFSIATLMIMLLMVVSTVFGTTLIKTKIFERYGNAIAGAIVCASGIAIRFLGV
jgi:nickel/cobalt transporter (NicO) family protein